MTKATILFLAANPKAMGSSVRLDEEARSIAESIQLGRERDCLEFHSAWAVRTRDLQRALLQHSPEIVHFSGHGDESGIYLENDGGDARVVAQDSLGSLFANFANTVRVVILNACESAGTIDAFRDVIDYTIGMNAVVSDRAAIVFSESFYGALAFGRCVREAFALAVNRLEIDGILERNTPVLHVRDGARSWRIESTPRRQDREKTQNVSIEMVGGSAGDITVVQGRSVVMTNERKARGPRS